MDHHDFNGDVIIVQHVRHKQSLHLVRIMFSFAWNMPTSLNYISKVYTRKIRTTLRHCCFEGAFALAFSITHLRLLLENRTAVCHQI